MKEFLKSTERHFATKELSKDFCKNEVGLEVSGFFTETEIHEKLEVADCKKIDLASSFFGDVLDVCCGNTKKAPVTKSFTLYVDLVKKMFKRNGDPGWTEQTFSYLQSQIKIFRKKEKQVFGVSQASCMRT